MYKNEKSCNDAKQKFEKEFPGCSVVSVIDYDSKSVIISAESSGERVIPGITYKVNKKTGEASFFSPMEDPAKYHEAASKRAVYYGKLAYLNDHVK